MRKLLITIYILITCSVNLFSQWSTNPNNNLIVGYGLDPHICSDSSGGCYITYDYNSTSYPRWLAVERLDKYGYKPWGTLKRILGETPEQSGAEIMEDGEGGVIVSYIDRFENLPNWTQKVKVQKVDSNGSFLWNQTGLRATLSEIYPQGGQNLCTDGNGGCVVVWHELHESLPTDTYDIIANRINNLGERVWGDSGIFLENTVNSDPAKIVRASDGNYYIQTSTIYRINQNGQILNQYSSTPLGQPVSDPEGGTILSGRIGNVYNRRLVAQRKDSLGNNIWQEPYVEIADSLYINAIINVKRIENYYYYTWHGRKNGIDLVAQYQALRSNGTKLFNEGNLPISNYPVDALIGDIIPSGSGTFLLIWQDYRSDDGVFGQRRDTLNNPFWNVNDIPLYTGTYSELHAITDCVGGAIGLGWNQFDFSIRAFKVSRNGLLGEVITNINHEYQITFPKELILYQNFPNPYNSSTTIQFQLPNEDRININLYNVLGEKIQTIVEGFYSRGMHSIYFIPNELPSGLYLYKLQTGNNSLTKKLIIIK